MVTPALLPVVVVVRHPDYENQYETFHGDVKVVDLDLGRSLGDHPTQEERYEWAEAALEQARELWQLGFTEAADFVESVAEEVRDGVIP